MTPGLTVVDQQIVELFAAADRVTVTGTNTYRQDSTGKTAAQSFCKMYQVADGQIVRFWGSRTCTACWWACELSDSRGR